MYLKIILTAQSKVVLRIIYILWHVSQVNSIVLPRDRKRSALLCFRKSGLVYGSPGGLEFSVLYFWAYLLIHGCPLAQSLGLTLLPQVRLNLFISTHPGKARCLQYCEPRIQNCVPDFKPHHLPMLS